MKKKSILAIGLFGGAVAAAAIFGSRFNPGTDPATGAWYRGLEKSPLNPPNQVFAPVWTTLYALIAIAAYRVWRAPASPERDAALRLWFAQLALNTAWSPLFFGAKQPALALADLLALVGTQAAFVHKAKHVDRTAAWLFAPYIAWVIFAGYLNAEIVLRNR